MNKSLTRNIIRALTFSLFASFLNLSATSAFADGINALIAVTQQKADNANQNALDGANKQRSTQQTKTTKVVMPASAGNRRK